VPPLGAARYIHSDIFDRLIKGPDDLSGLVAYGLYQQRKRQWMKAVKDERSCQPSEEELRAHAFGYRDDALTALRNEGESILFRFAEAVIDSRMVKISEEAFNARTTAELFALRGSIKRISGYKHHIVGHVVGFMVLVLLAFIFTVAITYEPHLASLFSRLRGGAH